MGTASSIPTGTISTVEIKKLGIYTLVPIAPELVPVVKKSHYDSGEEAYNIKKNLVNSKCPHINAWPRVACRCKALTYYENIVANGGVSSNAFLEAVTTAYNYHNDLVLSPDDVWMVICLQFANYVNNNAEAMRGMFVDHEEKKALVVVSERDLTEDAWDEFFDLMIKKIIENTKGEIVDTLQCNFTTTTPVEKIISTAVVMDTFKKYFEYDRCYPSCGIRNVLFMGSEVDWIKVLTKLKALKVYDVDTNLVNYVDQLVPVIEKFIDTYNGKVDKEFWDKIINIEDGSAGSGSTDYYSGWILRFFGIYIDPPAKLSTESEPTKPKPFRLFFEKPKIGVDYYDIRSYNIDVPIQIVNYMTGIKKTVSLVGGFGGIRKEEFDGYIARRPQMSFIVFHDGNEAPL
jgi:hypothetical protein